MGLLGDLQNAERFEHQRGPRCQVCNLLATLPADESQALQATIAEGKVTMAALARILTANGYRIAAGTISRHKAGACDGSA